MNHEPGLGSERRRFRRQACEQVASIRIGTATLGKCVIRDVSATGAKLTISMGSFEPKFFQLVLGEEGEALSVRKIWSKNGSMGVEFDCGGFGNG